MKKKKPLIIVMLLLSIGLSVNGQNEKFKALFLYNFLKNIEWPDSYKQGDIIIGVVGNSPICKELETIASNKKIGAQNIKVKLFNNVDEVKDCHLLYITPSKGSSVSTIAEKNSIHSVLIVSDSKGGIQQGSAINFIMNGDKLEFEISKNRIEQRGLKVSSQLISLGKLIS